MTVFSFGASTAEGKKDEAGGFIVRLGVQIEAAQLGNTQNHGIGGETTDDIVRRLNHIGEIQPHDIAIVTLGINDVPRTPDSSAQKRVPCSRHEQNIRQILTSLKARCRVLYVSQYPVQYVEKGLEPDTVAEYINTGIGVARELQIPVLDIFSLIDETRFQCFIHEDGMHFNSEGHAFIAEQIWENLQKGSFNLNPE